MNKIKPYNIKLDITLQKGGNGSPSRWKRSFQGGNGGNSGSVILNTTKYYTLEHISKYKYINNKGCNGDRNNRDGKNGKDINIYLCRSFIVDIYRNNKHYKTIIPNDNKYFILHGKRGGIGSYTTKSSNNPLIIGKDAETVTLFITPILLCDVLIIINFNINNFNIDNKTDKYIKNDIYIYHNTSLYDIDNNKSTSTILFINNRSKYINNISYKDKQYLYLCEYKYLINLIYNKKTL